MCVSCARDDTVEEVVTGEDRAAVVVAGVAAGFSSSSSSSSSDSSSEDVSSSELLSDSSFFSGAACVWGKNRLWNGFLAVSVFVGLAVPLRWAFSFAFLRIVFGFTSGSVRVDGGTGEALELSLDEFDSLLAERATGFFEAVEAATVLLPVDDCREFRRFDSESS